ncbi:MAG: hypothetical protein K1W35_00105 [Lachnospiraceae bacterium]
MQSREKDAHDDNKLNGGGNSGTMIVDVTCAPSNIRYLQDVSLLNEAEKMQKSCWMFSTASPMARSSVLIASVLGRTI